jgi:putative phosphoserine phosphatase/1-acylglycerol-3-phosphate O-acyltransferase
VNVSDLIDQIDSVARGPDVVAFFDMDGTVLAGFTAFVFAQERMKRPDRSNLGMAAVAVRYQAGNATFEELLRTSTRALAGMAESDIDDLADRLFTETIAAMIYPEVRRLIRAHQRRGHTVVLLSAATTMQVRPVANTLEVDDVICNTLIAADGNVTGEVAEPIIYGEQKALAAETYVANRKALLEDAFFYTDGYEDLPLLDAVGHPQPLNPDRKLRKASDERGWMPTDFESRGRPTKTQVVRTVLAQASVMTAATAGLLAGVLNRDRRQAINLMTSTWGDLAVALAGVNLDIRGEEHLWSHRPSVFLFNHQSNFDGLLLMKLLRRDVTAVAKEQLKAMPFVGQIFEFGDVIFINRSDHAAAVEALHDAAVRIREGLSVAISPEGTRQVTPTLGQFKKGGFHLAMEAGVPIVPIVIHNSLDVLPRGGRVMRPATVHVDVLEPILTGDWTVDELAGHVETVRRQFETALGQ